MYFPTDSISIYEDFRFLYFVTTLHCDQCMNLPCDAVTLLMVITSVLIYS